DANLAVAARRIAQTKWFNNGQTCVAPDYVLVHDDVKKEFVGLLQFALESFYGPQPCDSESYGRIVSQRQWNRLKSMLDEPHGGRVLVAGTAPPELISKYFPPTIVLDPSTTSRLMTEEVFGPILPVVSARSLEDALAVINAKEHSLASYAFTASQVV